MENRIIVGPRFEDLVGSVIMNVLLGHGSILHLNVSIQVFLLSYCTVELQGFALKAITHRHMNL